MNAPAPGVGVFGSSCFGFGFIGGAWPSKIFFTLLTTSFPIESRFGFASSS